MWSVLEGGAGWVGVVTWCWDVESKRGGAVAVVAWVGVGGRVWRGAVGLCRLAGWRCWLAWQAP